jgi:hypothetical protein
VLDSPFLSGCTQKFLREVYRMSCDEAPNMTKRFKRRFTRIDSKSRVYERAKPFGVESESGSVMVC